MRPPIPSKTNRPSLQRRTAPPPPRPRSNHPELAKPYREVPSLSTWQKDTKHGRPVGHKANDPILRDIDLLVGCLRSNATDGAYLYLLGRLYYSTFSWLNHLDKDPRMSPTCRRPIWSLNKFAANELSKSHNCSSDQLNQRLEHIYGVEMSPHGVETDTEAVQEKYLSTAKREEYRAFIIQGRAFNYRLASKQFKPLNSGQGGYRFVLSMNNELYAAAQAATSIKYHSSFMGGKPVMCAGDIWFDNGQVTKIKNSSGHYKPVDTSLVKLMNYLRMNGISPRTVTVETVAFINRGGKMVADERNSQTVQGDIFLKNSGNWNAILKRAQHQRAI